MREKGSARKLLLSSALWVMSDLVFATAGSLPQLQDALLLGSNTGRAELRLKFSDIYTLPKVVHQQSPNRLIWDLEHIKSQVPKNHALQKFENPYAKGLRIVQTKNKTRIVLDLNQNVPYEIDYKGTEVIVSLKAKQDPELKVNQELKTSLDDIDFSRGAKNEGRLLINMSNDASTIDLEETSNKLLVRINNTKLSPQLMHLFDVQEFNTPFVSFKPQQDKNDVLVEILTKGDFDKLAYQLNKQFIVELRAKTSDELAQAKKGVYTGKKLSLDFQSIDVRAVFKILADFTGLNIITSDEVKGNVTLSLQDVPWDQALDIILETKGLDKRTRNNVLLIGTQTDLAAQEKNALESSQKNMDLSPLRSDLFQLKYAKASDMALMLKDKNASLLSNRGNVTVDARTNTLLILDMETKLTEIKALLNRLDRPVQQVEIETQIVTATDSISDAFGVRFGGAGQVKAGRRTLGIGSTIERSRYIAENPGGVPTNKDVGGAPTIATGTALPLNDAASDTPPGVRAIEGLFSELAATGMSTVGKLGLSIANLPRNTMVDVELQALESESLAKVLSRPKLRTMDQVQASVEQGVSIPYTEASSSGASTVSFAQASLKLDVTPRITPDDFVSLDLKISNDSVGQTYNSVPSIDTNRLSTQVLVADGETVVLGGIFQIQDTHTRDKVPFFSKLPVIGSLFKRRYNSDQRKELLIFVTPRILKSLFVADKD